MASICNTPNLPASVEKVDIQFGGLTIPSAAVTRLVRTLVSLPIVRNTPAVVSKFRVDRPSNAEAWVAQLVGKEVTPCTHCLNGKGPFSGSPCVVVDGHFFGACASCQCNNLSRRCSFLSRLRMTVDLTDDNTADVGRKCHEKRSASNQLSGPSAPPSLRRRVDGGFLWSLSPRTRKLALGPLSQSESMSETDSAPKSTSDSAPAFASVFEPGSETTFVSASASASASALTPVPAPHTMPPPAPVPGAVSAPTIAPAPSTAPAHSSGPAPTPALASAHLTALALTPVCTPTAMSDIARTAASDPHPVRRNNSYQVVFQSQLELARLLTPSGRCIARHRHLAALAALDCVEGKEEKQEEE